MRRRRIMNYMKLTPSPWIFPRLSGSNSTNWDMSGSFGGSGTSHGIIFLSYLPGKHLPLPDGQIYGKMKNS